jgi:hypothetical protein
VVCHSKVNILELIGGQICPKPPRIGIMTILLWHDYRWRSVLVVVSCLGLDSRRAVVENAACRHGGFAAGRP